MKEPRLEGNIALLPTYRVVMHSFVARCLMYRRVTAKRFWLSGGAADFCRRIRLTYSPFLHHAAMQHLSAETKHHILLEYCPRERGRGFKALAARHNIKGGATLISTWHRRWDGTPQSLEEGARSGRPRALSSAQVRRHVAAPIRNANRAARVVSYTELLPQVQSATHTEISLRTLQHYGKEELHATAKHGKKRTSDECQ